MKKWTEEIGIITASERSEIIEDLSKWDWSKADMKKFLLSDQSQLYFGVRIYSIASIFFSALAIYTRVKSFYTLGFIMIFGAASMWRQARKIKVRDDNYINEKRERRLNRLINKFFCEKRNLYHFEGLNRITPDVKLDDSLMNEIKKEIGFE